MIEQNGTKIISGLIVMATVGGWTLIHRLDVQQQVMNAKLDSVSTQVAKAWTQAEHAAYAAEVGRQIGSLQEVDRDFEQRMRRHEGRAP